MQKVENEEASKYVGNVLLNAGAGAGKTSVIVSHILFLLEKILNGENKSKDNKGRDFSILQKMKEIVVITYTKDAAAEIKNRLRKECLKRSENDSRWDVFAKNHEQFNINTIHGFFFSLLRDGTILNINPNVVEGDFKDALRFKIGKLAEEYLGNHQQFCEMIIENFNEIKDALFDIFADAGKRINWDADGSKITYKEFWQKILDLNADEFKDVLKPIDLTLSKYREINKKTYFNYLGRFNDLVSKYSLYEEIYLDKYIEFFKEDFPRGAKDKIPVELKDRLSVINALKKFFKTKSKGLTYDKLLEVNLKNSDLVNIYAKNYKELFNYISNNYYRDNYSITYADMEYYTKKGLDDLNTLKLIRDKYKYFIIDEFQDTSPLQFDIIRKIVNDDLGKVYLVGDPGQSIYGFRGGGGEVFKLKDIKNELSLKYNYRSAKKIVDFNNTFFKDILPSLVKQQASKDEEGDVSMYCYNLNTDIKADEISVLEAHIIMQIINDLEGKNITVLYPKIKSSFNLVGLLLNKNMGVEVSLKLNYLQNPLNFIFNFLLMQYLSNNSDNISVALTTVLDAYCDYLGISKFDSNVVGLFFKNIRYLGIKTAFAKFLYDSRISFSAKIMGLDFLNNLFDSYYELEDVLNALNNSEKENCTISVRLGNNDKIIKISTMHGAKGLDFDNVILGGIHSGSKSDVLPFMGNIPYSYLWKDNKDIYSSIDLILEKNLRRSDNYRDRKNLLYVACTRAKYTLSYPLILKDQEVYSPRHPDSFAKLLADAPCKKIDIDFTGKDIGGQFNIPISITNSKYNFPIVPSSEMSVTGLSSIADCVRKFYLINICKFDEEAFSFFGKITTGGLSSRKRGDKLHLELEKLIKGYPVAIEKADDLQKITWAKNYLQSVRSSEDEFFCEKSLKFEIFNQMISGRIDYLIIKKDTVFIIDIKTGEYYNSHFLQLYLYAYGLSKILKEGENLSFKLVLLYLDKEDILEIDTNFIKMQQYISANLAKLNNLDDISLSHCKVCEANGMCGNGAQEGT